MFNIEKFFKSLAAIAALLFALTVIGCGGNGAATNTPTGTNEVTFNGTLTEQTRGGMTATQLTLVGAPASGGYAFSQSGTWSPDNGVTIGQVSGGLGANGTIQLQFWLNGQKDFAVTGHVAQAATRGGSPNEYTGTVTDGTGDQYSLYFAPVTK